MSNRKFEIDKMKMDAQRIIEIPDSPSAGDTTTYLIYVLAGTQAETLKYCMIKRIIEYDIVAGEYITEIKFAEGDENFDKDGAEYLSYDYYYLLTV